MTERHKIQEEDDISLEELEASESLVDNISLIPFRIANKCIAVPSNSVITFSDQVAIHSIPYNRNPVVKGLVAINHEVYTFISLSKLLNFGPRKITDNLNKRHSLYKRSLVVDLGGRTVVFYVDEVYLIYRCSEVEVSNSIESYVNSQILEGVIKNKGDWCDDCQLLNLSSTLDQLEIIVK